MESETLTAQAAQEQQRAAEDFQANIIRAGRSVQRPDGSVLSPKNQRYVTDAETPQPKLRVLPAYTPDPVDDQIIIDIDIPEVDDRTFILRSKNGNTILHVPAPLMDHAFRIGRFQHLLMKTFEKMKNTTDDNVANTLNDEIMRLQKKLLKLIVPDIDPQLVNRLPLRAMNEIITQAENMVQQSMSVNVSPLTYIRRIYRIMGSPEGDNDRGLFLWLRDHFHEIEEAFGDNELPN